MAALKDHLNSAYIDAANSLYPKQARRRIVAYVESYDDIAFWHNLLGEFEDEKRYFQVMLPSSATLTKGKKMVLMNTLNTSQLGRSMIACVDSDYDFLLQNTTQTSRKINGNDFIFQTYTYAIENYLCFAQSLHQVCVQATLNDHHLLDFVNYLSRYSQIVYPLFLWNILFYKNGDTNTFSMRQLNVITTIHEFDVHNTDRSLQLLEKRVAKELKSLTKRFPDKELKLVELEKDLCDLGLVPTNTYLYMQGHHIMNNVVLKLLYPVCEELRREREAEIMRLAAHHAQYKNEMMCYRNRQVDVTVMLSKNTAYKKLFHYEWLRKDIIAFLDGSRA